MSLPVAESKGINTDDNAIKCQRSLVSIDSLGDLFSPKNKRN